MSHNMEAIATRLRQSGYRVTPQRQLILDAVCRLGGHVTAEDVTLSVQKIAPTINQGTVYRTLNFFCEQGIVCDTRRQDGITVYEIAGQHAHHHFVCTYCGANHEVPAKILQPLFDRAQKRYDFVVEMDHITFFGRCKTCH